MNPKPQFTEEEAPGQGLPEGLRYQPGLITDVDEDALIARVSELPFKEFEFHGYLGKRRVVSFGWQYEFAGAGKLRKADDIPAFLQPIRMRAAAFAGLKPDQLQHVLVIEYAPGAGIGWHRDKPEYGQVMGLSLASACVLRLRKAVGSKWERVSVQAAPRSAYLFDGPVRWEWEHSIPAVESLRYSVTFRTLRSSR